MSTPAARIITLAMLYVFIFVFGFLLNRTGKPYGTLLLTAHKLVSLAAIAFLILTVIRHQGRLTGLSVLEPALCILAALSFVILIASGGWLSAARSAPPWAAVVHRFTPFINLATTAVILYLWFRRR